MRAWHTISVILLAIGMSGCVPFPHSITLSSEISGKPVEGASVFLATGPESSPCNNVIQAVSTASDGSFVIPKRSQLRFLYAPLVAPISVAEFTVCVRSERGTQMGYRGVVRLSEAGRVTLRCDPSRPLRLRGFDMLPRELICEERIAERQTSNWSLQRER